MRTGIVGGNGCKIHRYREIYDCRAKAFPQVGGGLARSHSSSGKAPRESLEKYAG